MSRLTHGPGCVKAPTIWAKPLVVVMELIEANPNFAIVKFLDGRESTVSVTDLAPSRTREVEANGINPYLPSPISEAETSEVNPSVSSPTHKTETSEIILMPKLDHNQPPTLL